MTFSMSAAPRNSEYSCIGMLAPKGLNKAAPTANRRFSKRNPSSIMPETRVIAKAVPKADQKEKVKQLLRDMIAPSLAEPGVRAYDLHETQSGDQFYLFEVYESRDVFEAHKASPHFQRLSAVLPDLLAEPLEIIELTQIK